jgi:hypothetical protein
VSWTRYEGTAPADATLSGAARDAELEDFLRLQNPHLTDLRLEQATAIGSPDTGSDPNQQWYSVTYLADDGEGYVARD